MQYNFSADFLRVDSPDTSFSEAWETLCEALLRAANSAEEIIRFRPPDLGVDLLQRSRCRAYQCKSTVHGAAGTIKVHSSMKSLERAIDCQDELGWRTYVLATNALYTGAPDAQSVGRRDPFVAELSGNQNADF